MKRQDSFLVLIVVLMVLLAALSRVLFYPLNYSPQIAMALFAGSVIKDKKFAFALPLFAMLLADICFELFTSVPGFWGWGQVVNYGIFAVITMIGFTLKKLSVINIAGYSILTSLVFYFLSNSASFLVDNRIFHTYTEDFSGYITCMAAGVPFLEKGLVVDLIFSAVFFGGYALMLRSSLKKEVAVIDHRP